MKNLIIDATGNKILLIIINDKNIYTSSHENSKSNFDKITILINDFLKKYKTTLSGCIFKKVSNTMIISREI